LKIAPFICSILLFIFSCKSPDKKAEVLKDKNFEVPRIEISADSIAYYNTLLTNYFDTSLLKGNFNGAILVSKSGNTLFENYTGYSNLEKKDTLTDSTSFHVASVSKTVTGVAILMLVAQKKLSLSDRVEKFFPGFPYPLVTVQTLLNHRSGIPNYLNFLNAKVWDKNKNVTNDNLLTFLIKNKPPLEHATNTHFSYSNTNFVLLASIVEKVSGQNFRTFVKENIFEPASMKHTFIYELPKDSSAMFSYRINKTRWNDDNMERTYGDKNMYTTVRDLAKFSEALFAGALIPNALLDSLKKPYSNERPSIHNYGLGMRLLEFPNGKKVIYHFGRWHGFNAVLSYLPDEKVTIAITGNMFNRQIYNCTHEVYNFFGNYQRTDLNEEDDLKIDALKDISNLGQKSQKTKKIKKQKDGK